MIKIIIAIKMKSCSALIKLKVVAYIYCFPHYLFDEKKCSLTLSF